MKNPTNKEEPSRTIRKQYFENLDTFLRTDMTEMVFCYQNCSDLL